MSKSDDFGQSREHKGKVFTFIALPVAVLMALAFGAHRVSRRKAHVHLLRMGNRATGRVTGYENKSKIVLSEEVSPFAILFEYNLAESTETVRLRRNLHKLNENLTRMYPISASIEVVYYPQHPMLAVPIPFIDDVVD